MCARCGPRLLAPSPGRNHAGQKRACRDAGVPCRSLGCCDPWSGKEGARVVRMPERRGTPPGHPTPPRGMVRAPRGAEPSGKSGAGWRWAPGSHPSDTVRARRERSLPPFPVFAVPASAASPCASRACVSLVAACRVESPRSPSPRQRSHDRGAAVTRPSSGPGIRFWRRGLVTSLSGAAFGETAVGPSPARRRTRRGPSPPEVLRRRRARLSRRWVCACEWGKRRPPRVSGNLAREKRLSGRRPWWSACATVGPSAEVRLGTLPAPSSVLREGRSRRTCGGTAIRAGLGAWR